MVALPQTRGATVQVLKVPSLRQGKYECKVL
jgi:hypothetical protein